MDEGRLEPPPPPTHRPAGRRRHQPGSGAVAMILAAAAIAAALVATGASLVSNNASDAWQSALRTEVKRSAAAMNDVSYLYQIEFSQAVGVLPAPLFADALRAAQAGQSAEVAQALETEAAAQTQFFDLMAAAIPLLEDTTYRLPAGGLDLGKRLADIRADGPDGLELLALDPDGRVAAGDELAAKASLLTYALIPLGLCALLGALAQPLPRWRSRLLLASLVALVGGSLLASIVWVAA